MRARPVGTQGGFKNEPAGLKMRGNGEDERATASARPHSDHPPTRRSCGRSSGSRGERCVRTSCRGLPTDAGAGHSELRVCADSPRRRAQPEAPGRADRVAGAGHDLGRRKNRRTASRHPSGHLAGARLSCAE